MKVYKEIMAVLFIVVLVVMIVIQVSETSRREYTNTPSIENAQSKTTDDMSGHHGKQQAVDNTVFESLLGRKAPDFTLPSFKGETIALGALLGKNVILFFNEGEMCYPSCWSQVSALNNDKALSNDNTVSLSITVDSENIWEKATLKMPELANATVLLDTNRSVSQSYGVLSVASSMHKGQFPGHSYVLIDKEGIVRFVKDDSQMGVNNNELVAELSKI